MIAKAECHFAAPYQITDLLAGCGPQIELDRNRTLSELAQHVDDVGVREGTDQRQRNRPAFLADCRLYCLPPVLDRRQDRLANGRKARPASVRLAPPWARSSSGAPSSCSIRPIRRLIAGCE